LRVAAAERIQRRNTASHVGLQVSLSHVLLQRATCHCHVHRAVLSCCYARTGHWTAPDRAPRWPIITTTSFRTRVYSRHRSLALHPCRIPNHHSACQVKGTATHITAFFHCNWRLLRIIKVSTN